MDNPSVAPSKTPRRATQVVLVVFVLLLLAAAAFWIVPEFGKTNTANTNTASIINPNANKNYNSELNANATTNGNSSLNTNVVADTNAPINTNFSVGTSDWLSYVNDVYHYQIKYPREAEVVAAAKSLFRRSQSEEQQGITVDQLYDQYTGNICLTINYENIGYVMISAPINNEKLYVLCGRTGVGVLKNKTPKQGHLTINGKEYTYTGNEFTLPSPSEALANTLDYHQETLDVVLDDKTQIEIGTRASSSKLFTDYETIREILLTIAESYKQIRNP